MASQAAAGTTLLDAGKYDEAIEKFTAALAINSSAPDYYIKRSTAYQRKKPADYGAALSDAEIAVVAATTRGRRELIAQAQMRRAIALFCLERYADAGFVLDVVKELDPKEKSVGMWVLKVQQKLKTLEEGDEKSNITVEKIPQVSIPEPAGAKSSETASKASSSKAVAAPAAGQPTPAGKIKHDWYQSTEKIHLTIMAKGVDLNKVDVDLQPNFVNVSFPTGSDQEYNLSLEPLFAQIDADASSHKFTSTKLEFTLVKAVPGQWATLEGDGSAATAAPTTTSGSTPSTDGKRAVSGAAVGPSYPTSSKSGPKNWDKLASEIGDEADGGDDVNRFFQTLYKGADSDTQRAMMKSYQESNGTVLSTNWSEVGKGKVETAPPDGMTAKKWTE